MRMRPSKDSHGADRKKADRAYFPESPSLPVAPVGFQARTKAIVHCRARRETRESIKAENRQ